jgi:hypothetical protein
LLDDGQKGLACFLAVDSSRPGADGMRIEQIYDLLAELACFVEQAQIGRITNRLTSHRGVKDQLAAIAVFRLGWDIKNIMAKSRLGSASIAAGRGAARVRVVSPRLPFG